MSHPTRSIATAANSTVPDPDLFLTEKQAADMLNVNPRTLQQWRRRRTGPQPVPISKRCIRYSYREVIRWTERLQATAHWDSAS